MKHEEDKLITNDNKEFVFCKRCGYKKPKEGWKTDCNGNNS